MKQKTINRLLTSLLIFGIFACSNDSTQSPMFTKFKTDYSDLHVYQGTSEGATEVEIYTNTSWDRDSLYQTRVNYRYFGSEQGEYLIKQNKISFEFLDEGDLLSFIDQSTGQRIISTYTYDGDDLYILKDGITRVFVARKDTDGTFYRIVSLQAAILKSGEETVEKAEHFDGDNAFNLDTASEFAGFPDKDAMTHPRDTVAWCRVKYIYR